MRTCESVNLCEWCIFLSNKCIHVLLLLKVVSAQQKSNYLIQHGTGSGKSRTIAALAWHLLSLRHGSAESVPVFQKVTASLSF